MNRMWVRFSLAFAVVIFVMAMVIGFTARLTIESTMDPEGEVPAEVRDYFRQLRSDSSIFNVTTLAFIVGGVAIVAGVWMSRTLTRPLSELGEAAKAIGSQDLSRRVRVHGSDEVQAVAVRFNEMAELLEDEETLRQNLLTDVAHELRNPLHVLQGNLQAMLDGVYPIDRDEITRLSQQTRHLTTLVDDLHELAQAEAHQLTLRKHKTDMAAIVKETVAAFNPIAASKEIGLTVELLGTVPVLDVDGDRIRQALSNLVSNAVRHTPDQGSIRVSTETKEDELQIRVRDTGPGIAPEQLGHVFDRFYRTDSARSRETGGTGLGLSITRAIAEAHGGRVTVVSDGLGMGSAFTIHLPLEG